MLDTIEDKIDSYLNKHSHYRDKEHNLLLESDVICENNAFSLHKFAAKNNSLSRVLLVPSIINGPEILYLDQNYSLVEILRQNSDIFLVKWKNINNHTRNYNFNDYVLEISNLLEFFEEKIEIYGHCLGGNIAFAASYLNQEKLSRLTLLTTPWDFSHYAKVAKVEETFRNYDEIPAIFLEIMFFLQNPMELLTRLNKQNCTKISYKIEKWLHSGNNMAKNTYFQIMQDFIQNNILEKNAWYIGKDFIDPGAFQIYTRIINCSFDKIVPPSSTAPLLEKLPNAEIFILESGHIGYLTNPQFKNELELFIQNLR
jgi:polyhydroxyalkanoate synthase